MVYADLDFDLIVKEKALMDTTGHTSKPELLWLGRNVIEQKPVRSESLKYRRWQSDQSLGLERHLE